MRIEQVKLAKLAIYFVSLQLPDWGQCLLAQSAALSTKLRKMIVSKSFRTMSFSNCHACLSARTNTPDSAMPFRSVKFGSSIGLQSGSGWEEGSAEGLGAREKPLFACNASAARRSNHRTDARSAVRNSEPTVSVGESAVGCPKLPGVDGKVCRSCTGLRGC
jgi:hypothetical protein